MRLTKHSLWALLFSLALSVTACDEQPRALLLGRAVLPAATFAKGPTSGGQIGAGPINGQSVPFIQKQPVQGFSAVRPLGDGRYQVMSDNGYGSLENSADYNLRVYTITPHFKTPLGGSGKIKVGPFIELSDPHKKIPFAIVNHFTKARILTGADFDIESFQKAPDGSYWFGDEFGPFLLHTDARGVLLEAPIPLPDFENPGQEIRAPQNPYNEESSAVRIMNAVTQHGLNHGVKKRPVFSPYHLNLKDGNPDVQHYARDDSNPPDLKPAASGVFDVSSLQKAGYKVVTWTVNDKARMLELMELGVDGIISDRPDLLLEALREYKDGVYLTAQGLINQELFDAQGHRGARNLRPENTLPAMEAALDNLMGTLETDAAISRDKTPLLNHDPYIESSKCRRTDGGPQTEHLLVKNLKASQIQADYICDKLFRGDSQKNDQALSPATAAFAQGRLPHIYAMPTLEQLFQFVDYYVEYYTNGAGRSHPMAAQRAQNAARVRFNVETKINPRVDKDGHGNIYKDRTFEPKVFVRRLTKLIRRHKLTDRADIQSFDYRSLLRSQKIAPKIRTVYLMGDFPQYDHAWTDDGTNMQDINGRNTPWMAGLYWPYRITRLDTPLRAQTSGGFEGMALSADGRYLLPLLEKPLEGSPAGNLLIHEFSLAEKRYTGKRYVYPLNERGTAIGDFIMTSETQGLVIERDGSQGDLEGFKSIQKITLGADGAPVKKEALVDLLDIADPFGLGMGLPGDVGVNNPFRFSFPFETIESVVLLGADKIGVLNDNNFPFSVGRHVGSGEPDDNEFIILKLPKALR